ncbi:MAG TPA: hypothetical protein VF188_16660 [Longimicrobiales bacterium]
MKMRLSQFAGIPVLSAALLLVPSPGEEGMTSLLGVRPAEAAACKIETEVCWGVEIGGWSAEFCVSHEVEVPCAM